MTPDFVAVDQNSTVGDVLDRVRETPMTVLALYLTDSENRLIGSTSLQDLLRARRESCIGDAAQPIAVRLGLDADFTEVALLMADYNLTEIPVVDEDNRLVGVIAVDDVLETLIPDEWRRRETGSIG
jgi:Mg/Co/Ni transporter MgtE